MNTIFDELKKKRPFQYHSARPINVIWIGSAESLVESGFLAEPLVDTVWCRDVSETKGLAIGHYDAVILTHGHSLGRRRGARNVIRLSESGSIL
jgi:hypothetical protein